MPRRPSGSAPWRMAEEEVQLTRRCTAPGVTGHLGPGNQFKGADDEPLAPGFDSRWVDSPPDPNHQEVDRKKQRERRAGEDAGPTRGGIGPNCDDITAAKRCGDQPAGNAQNSGTRASRSRGQPSVPHGSENTGSRQPLPESPQTASATSAPPRAGQPAPSGESRVPQGQQHRGDHGQPYQVPQPEMGIAAVTARLAHARMPLTTLPWTSVRRKSRPWKR